MALSTKSSISGGDHPSAAIAHVHGRPPDNQEHLTGFVPNGGPLPQLNPTFPRVAKMSVYREDDLRRGSSVKRVIVSMMTATTGSSFGYSITAIISISTIASG
jgi:hypothetical protein